VINFILWILQSSCLDLVSDILTTPVACHNCDSTDIETYQCSIVDDELWKSRCNKCKIVGDYAWDKFTAISNWNAGYRMEFIKGTYCIYKEK